MEETIEQLKADLAREIVFNKDLDKLLAENNEALIALQNSPDTATAIAELIALVTARNKDIVYLLKKFGKSFPFSTYAQIKAGLAINVKI